MSKAAIGRLALMLGVLVLIPALNACAVKPTDPDDLEAYNEAHDPAEPTNRFIYMLNDKFDTYFLRPLAIAYRDVTPQRLVREPIHNMLLNLDSPVIFANDVLQGKPKRAAATLARFIVNTTAGIGGLIDVAALTGLKHHDAGFGYTLAVWGVPGGPFVELPFYGPSNPRDAVGLGMDFVMDPFTWIGKGATVDDLYYTRFGLTALDKRERALDTLDAIKKTSLDPYATIRSLYRQNEAAEISALKAGDQF